MRAAEYLAVDGPGRVEISAESGASCHFIHTIVSDGAGVQYPELAGTLLSCCHTNFSP